MLVSENGDWRRPRGEPVPLGSFCVHLKSMRSKRGHAKRRKENKREKKKKEKKKRKREKKKKREQLDERARDGHPCQEQALKIPFERTRNVFNCAPTHLFVSRKTFPGPRQKCRPGGRQDHGGTCLLETFAWSFLTSKKKFFFLLAEISTWQRKPWTKLTFRRTPGRPR